MLLVFVATAVACIDFYYSMSMRASCSGVSPAEIRAAIASDPSIEIRDFVAPDPSFDDRGPGREVLSLWAMRDGDIVHVTVREDPGVVRLTAGDGAPPDHRQRAQWLRSVQYVAERIDEACPGVGAWETDDSTQPSRWPSLACLLTVVLAVGGLVWLIRRLTARPSVTSTPDGSS